MKAIYRYIAALCREEVDNDDLFLCMGTLFVFFGMSLIHIPSALIFAGVVFFALAYISALPPKQQVISDGES